MKMTNHNNKECNHTSPKVETKFGEYCAECRWSNSWTERLEKRFFSNGRVVKEANEIIPFISAEIQKERQRICEELLEKGHGSGNWRRIITQIKSRKH